MEPTIAPKPPQNALDELKEAQEYTKERLEVLKYRLANVSVQGEVAKDSITGQYLDDNHLGNRIQSQHVINDTINQLIMGLLV